jgi:transcriptional antiterminator
LENEYKDCEADKEMLNVNQTAELLQCSTKTIRNKIKNGDITAKLVDSPYGKQYAIPRAQFEVASTVIDVVTVSNELKLKEFGAILSTMLDEQNKKVIEEVQEMKVCMEKLQSTNERLLTRIERLEDQHFSKLDNKLNDLREQLEERKGEKQNWLQRLLKK